jgi:hypothetical protein
MAIELFFNFLVKEDMTDAVGNAQIQWALAQENVVHYLRRVRTSSMKILQGDNHSIIFQYLHPRQARVTLNKCICF